MICQSDNAAGEVYPILPRCRKSHVKQQIQYELTCFNPFLATRCLHVANDFRVYSQLSLPICRLSAYTLCVWEFADYQGPRITYTCMGIWSRIIYTCMGICRLSGS